MVLTHPIPRPLTADLHRQEHSFRPSTQQNDLDGVEKDQQIQSVRHILDIKNVVGQLLFSVLK
jgi:hypothetical protein